MEQARILKQRKTEWKALYQLRKKQEDIAEAHRLSHNMKVEEIQRKIQVFEKITSCHQPLP